MVTSDIAAVSLATQWAVLMGLSRSSSTASHGVLVVLQALHKAYESLSHTAARHTSAQNGHEGTPPASTQHPPATGHSGAAHTQKHTAGSQSDGQLSWTTEERESGSPRTNGQDHAHNRRDHAPRQDGHQRSRCSHGFLPG